MKLLLVLRHAKSSWKNPGQDDHDRPLNKRGKHDAPRVGKRLAEASLVPERILTSTAKRARRTAEAVAEASGYSGEISEHAGLYLAHAGAILDHLRGLADDCHRAMTVGHNPGMEELVTELTGDYQVMPTAALAFIELDIGRWADIVATGGARLVEVWRPREAPSDSR